MGAKVLTAIATELSCRFVFAVGVLDVLVVKLTMRAVEQVEGEGTCISENLEEQA
jgi:hypothetical protein